MKHQSWKIIVDKLSSFKMRKGITSFVNPYSMLLLKDKKDIANGVDQWCIDGISLVKEINKYKGTTIDRYSFDDTSLAPVVFSFARKHNLKIAIIGTKENLIGRAVENIEAKYGVKISYWRNGYFFGNEDEETIKTIRNENFDLVICGMGTPYQEQFLMKLKLSGWDGYGFTCGGYLHQMASDSDYYPAFFDRWNIRWVYRIIDEPKLFRRYFIDYPAFYIQFRSFKKTGKPQ